MASPRQYSSDEVEVISKADEMLRQKVSFKVAIYSLELTFKGKFSAGEIADLARVVYP